MHYFIQACPHCHKSGWIKKNGHFRGKQRYYCKACQKSFLEEYSFPEIENEDHIIEAWIHGSENLSQIARRFSISNYHLKKIITNRYKDKLDKLKNEITVNNSAIKTPTSYSLLKKQLRKEAKK